MFRETIIRIFATAMALASSGIVFGAVAPEIQTVQIGSVVQVTGSLQVGCVAPATRCASAILHNLSKRMFVLEANDRLRPVERVMLKDDGTGVDLVRLAQVLPVDTRITVNATFDHAEAKVASKLPLHSSDTLRVAQLKIDGIDLVRPAGAEATRIEKLATVRTLRYVEEVTGTAPTVTGVEVLTNDHAVVSIQGAKVLVVLSGDDELHVIEGSLR